ncbi:SCO6745 family protein [Dermatobacter hominis]|uniref:SCO6745 family protein n=1 Tax=Dermatobacter hominis TaxID=2884263 RepID=UPI001D0FF01D|nr:hypothetical protein [Dermatobacter hominis]UDY38006.1 hypothetical protein LH044_10780 [Dermatobacter hominis]
MATDPARRLWQAAETVHAVTYFHPAALAAIADAGARGFWMGYFAARMAPLGPIGPSTATAVCCNFSPARTTRALPDAWSFVSPADALAARSRGAVAALTDCGLEAEGAAAAAAALEPIVAGLDPSGRPLGGANLDVELPAEPIARLWQLCTTLREHRGDGHVALLVGADLDGCEVDVLATAASGMDAMILRDTRAWTHDEWAAAAARLADRDLVTTDGGLTDAGRALHVDIERRTDALATRSYEGHDLAATTDALRPLARTVAAAGVLPFPNPMGLREG